MLQIARPQSAAIPIPLTRGLKETWSANPGTLKVHSRTGNFSCASKEYSEEDRVSIGIDYIGRVHLNPSDWLQKRGLYSITYQVEFLLVVIDGNFLNLFVLEIVGAATRAIDNCDVDAGFYVRIFHDKVGTIQMSTQQVVTAEIN
jgi:hypothetical protein